MGIQLSTKRNFSLTLGVFLFSFNLFGFNFKEIEDQLNITMTLSIDGAHIAENEKKISEICNELSSEYEKNKSVDALMLLKFFETARKENPLHLNQKINNLLYIINKCDKKHVNLIAYANYGLAGLLIQNGSNENALQYINNVLALLRQKKNIELEKLTYNQNGILQLNMNDYINAKSSFYKAFKLDQNSPPFFQATVLSNIAACDFVMKDFQNAEKLFRQAITLLVKNPGQLEQKYTAFLKGNLGSTCLKLGKKEQAIENLWYEINYFSSRKLFLPFLNESFNDLLTIYLENSDDDELNKLLQMIHFHGKNQKDPVAIFSYKELLLKYYKTIGDKNRTLSVLEEMMELQQKIKEDDQKKTNKINSTFYSNKIDFINSKFKNEELLFNNELKQKKTINYTIILFSILIGFSLLYLLKQRNLKLKNIELTNRQTIEIENAKRIIVEKELKLKKEMVANLSIFLTIKTETEKAFLKKLKELKGKKNQDAEDIFRELQNNIIALMNLEKLNLEILNTVELDNADIIEKINLKFPVLNKLECKLCSYFQLALSSKEISLITDLTPGTIRVYKAKIKQKLKLNEEQSLNDYLQELFLD